VTTDQPRPMRRNSGALENSDPSYQRFGPQVIGSFSLTMKCRSRHAITTKSPAEFISRRLPPATNLPEKELQVWKCLPEVFRKRSWAEHESCRPEHDFRFVSPLTFERAAIPIGKGSISILAIRYPGNHGCCGEGVHHLSDGCSKRRFARSCGVGFNSPVTPTEKLCS